MRKHLYFLLVGLGFGACSTAKISEQERFFQPSTNASKVYIYTVHPSETSSSQQFLSALLLTSSTNNTLSINTFLYSYDGKSQGADFTHFFTDSIQLLNESTFPINFIAAKEYSARPSYFHSFKRDRIEFEHEDPTQAISAFDVRFSKQNPFQIIEAGTDLEISGSQPIHAELHSLNGRILDQESIVHLHAMDSIQTLFNHRKSDRYYWLDFAISEESGSLFFRQTTANDLLILLNTLPSFQNLEVKLEPNASDPSQAVGSIALKMPEGNYQILPLKTTSNGSDPTQFWVGAVEIINTSTQKRVGVGNLFVL